MKCPKYLIAAILLFLIFGFSAESQTRSQKDIYGREILNNRGEKINYQKTDNSLTAPLKSEAKFQKIYSEQVSYVIKDTMSFDNDRLFSLMGTSIGRNSMHSLDINNDGTVELICTASSQLWGNADFWYIMHYNKIDSTCEKIWISPVFESLITCLEVSDMNGDSNYEILVGFYDGSLKIYNGQTFELISESRPITEPINSIVLADADNDSEKELVISSDSHIFLINVSNCRQIEYSFESSANSVRVGNTNSDTLNEIVLSSGTIYQLNGTEMVLIWDFISGMEGYVELSDIDGDLMLEVIYAQSWYNINVYDVDTKSMKYTIESDLDIQALLLKDVNNDGVDEILYGDGQWGEVYCYNAVNQNKMWSVNNPEHGVTAINYADLDNDGKDELVWGAGWTSSGPDYLYIYSVAEGKLRWHSSDIVGPFYAVASGDVDGDGKPEIVAVSNASESGYESGVIFIFDAQTNKLKWQSSGNFLYGVWTGVYNLILKDIDKDGSNEIIIAAGVAYTGAIWIIDGKNHIIKSWHEFSAENMAVFYALAIDDIDNDSDFEIIAITDAHLYVINSSDWSVEWEKEIQGYYSNRVVKCGDITGDGQKEVIICNGFLQVVSPDHSIWTSPTTNFSNIDLFDFDRDGISDIITCSADGYISVIDGITKQQKNIIRPEASSIESVRLMNFKDSNLIIYSSNGRMNYLVNDSICLVSQSFGIRVGEVEGLQLFSNADSTMILLGTSISVIQITGKTFNCAGFTSEIEKSEASCDNDDGKILLHPFGGTAPYSFRWNDGSTLDSIVNLSPGSYSVMIQDNSGCGITRKINLSRAFIGASIIINDAGCNVNGSAHINLDHINQPSTITWSNSSNGPDLLNVPAGEYGVVITDSKNCVFEETVLIPKDTIIIYPYVQSISCYGRRDGSIYLETINGVSPMTYEWDAQISGNYANNLGPDTYDVKVTDALGCSAEFTIEITEPGEITYQLMVSPDDPATLNWEGKIMLNNIQGGTSPYNVFWTRFSEFTDYLDVLPAGSYEFIITDYHNCQVKDTAFVTSYTSTPTSNTDIPLFNVYPNPAKDELFISTSHTAPGNCKFELINSKGQIVKSLSEINDKDERIDLTGIEPGIYMLLIHIDESVYFNKVIIE